MRAPVLLAVPVPVSFERAEKEEGGEGTGIPRGRPSPRPHFLLFHVLLFHVSVSSSLSRRWMQVQTHCRACPVCKAGIDEDRVREG